MKAKKPLLGTPQDIPESFTLKYKTAYYDAVPHLFDGPDDSEVVVCWNKEKPKQGFLNNDGGKFWCFKEAPKTAKTNDTSMFVAFASIIKAQGQLDPIFVDEEGNVLDGYARWFACIKEGLGTPKIQVISGLGDDAAKTTWIRSRKLARHHLTEKQRMAIVSAEIKAHQERSNSWTAMVLGVSGTTVSNYRSRLEESKEIKGRKQLIGSDGRKVRHESKTPQTQATKGATQHKAAKSNQGKNHAAEGNAAEPAVVAVDDPKPVVHDAAEPAVVAIDDPKPVDHDPDRKARSFVESLGTDKKDRNTLTGLLRSLVILMRSWKEKVKEQPVEQDECEKSTELLEELDRLLKEIKEEFVLAANRSQSVTLVP